MREGFLARATRNFPSGDQDGEFSASVWGIGKTLRLSRSTVKILPGGSSVKS